MMTLVRLLTRLVETTTEIVLTVVLFIMFLFITVYVTNLNPEKRLRVSTPLLEWMNANHKCEGVAHNAVRWACRHPADL